MNDQDLYIGASLDFDRKENQVESNETVFVIEKIICNCCQQPYEQEDMRSGTCEVCEKETELLKDFLING